MHGWRGTEDALHAASQRTFLGEMPLRDQVAESHCSALLAPDHLWTIRILHRRGELAICTEDTRTQR